MCCQQHVKSTWGPQGPSSTGAFPGPPAVALGNLCRTDRQPAPSTGCWELPPLVPMHERNATSSRKRPQLLKVSCPLQFPTLLNGHMPVPLPSLDRAPSPVLLSSSSQKSWWLQESWPSSSSSSPPPPPSAATGHSKLMKPVCPHGLVYLCHEKDIVEPC